MKTVKKVSVAIAFLCTMSMAAPLGVSAVYDPCDVNHDGDVDIMDVIAVNKYLSGNSYFPNYNQLDANKSMTVDLCDADFVLAAVTEIPYTSAYFSRATGTTVAYPTISGFTPNSASTSTESRTYMRYKYATHTQLSNYTLSPASPLSTNGDDNTDVIVDGLDSRYAAFGEENTGIVRISSVGGTGFVVGDHEIATAAHCVYNKSTSSWNTMTIETYDSNGLPSGITLTPVEAHFPLKFKTLASNAMYDYAVITVEEDLSNYVHFALGTSYNVTATNYSTVPLYVTGCPSRINNHPNSSNRLYSEEGHVYGQSNTSVLHYDVDTSGGDSGSPVYTITRNVKNGVATYTYTALAIHKGSPNGTDSSYNWGSLITKYHHQFYRSNSYLNH